MRAQLSALALTLPLVAVAQQAAWDQCGGNNWTGSKSCVSGYSCHAQSEWYSQCIPSTSDTGSSNSNGNSNGNANGDNSDNSNSNAGDDDAVTSSIPISKPTTKQQPPPQQTTTKRTTSQRTTQKPQPTTTKAPAVPTSDPPRTTITTVPDPVISTLTTKKVSTVTRRTITRSTISTQEPSQPTQEPSQPTQPSQSDSDSSSPSQPSQPTQSSSSGDDQEISTQPVGQQPNNGQQSGSSTTVTNGGSSISWEDAFPSGGSSGTITTTFGKRATQAGPGTTLQSGYYWVRGVEQPNFHKYLQTSPTYASGNALLSSYTTAGQFKIEDGQLVELISEPGATAEFLYAHVLPNTTVTQKLAMTFNTTKSDYGTFAWSGDALTWSHPNVKRQNLAAWLVCGSSQLFINTGAYNYQTPAGCSDSTVHYYNDKKANN